MLSLYCLGGGKEVGRSAILLKGDKNILLDYGIKVYDKSGKTVYPISIENINLDAAIITHAHLDHSGYVPYIYKNQKIRWYATAPTYDIADVLWQDTMKIQKEELPWKISHYKKALKYWHPLSIHNTMNLGNFKFKFLDAGHIAGAVMVKIECKKKILYSGDFKFEKTRMHKGAEKPEEVDILIIESTYADREHPNRDKLEREFIEEIWESLNEGGSVLCPTFAVGRTQEIIRVIRAYDKDIPIYLDGMAKEITRIYLKYKQYFQDYENFVKDVESVYFVENERDRKKALRENSVIISTAGMLEGGPAFYYLKHLNSYSKIIFTGYTVEGTNGWLLLNKGQIKLGNNIVDVDLPVKYLDFSAHAGRSDLLKLIKYTNPEKIICVHGDRAIAENFEKELKEKGFEAKAFENGERIEL